MDPSTITSSLQHQDDSVPGTIKNKEDFDKGATHMTIQNTLDIDEKSTTNATKVFESIFQHVAHEDGRIRSMHRRRSASVYVVFPKESKKIKWMIHPYSNFK